MKQAQPELARTHNQKPYEELHQDFDEHEVDRFECRLRKMFRHLVRREHVEILRKAYAAYYDGMAKSEFKVEFHWQQAMMDQGHLPEQVDKIMRLIEREIRMEFHDPHYTSSVPS